MAKNEQTEAEVELAKAEKDRKMREAYGAAAKRLREAHRDEFNNYYAAEAEDRGYDWKPKLTPAQKAEAEMARLIAEYPDLLDKIVPPDPQAEGESEAGGFVPPDFVTEPAKG